MNQYPPLTAFRIFFDDGTNYATSMAAGVTLQQATDYYVGQRFEKTETTFRTAIRVEQETPCFPSSASTRPTATAR